MLIKLRKRMAQSTLEYAVLAVVVIGALLSIQTFLKRSIAGKIKSSADDISAEKYDPELTEYNKTTVTNSYTNEVTNQEGVVTNMLAPENVVTNFWSNTNEAP